MAYDARRSRLNIWLTHERRVFLFALAGGLPAVIGVALLLHAGAYTAKVQWTVGVIVIGCWLGFASAVRERVVRPLQTLSNLLAALREGDYSIRARGANIEDALGLAYAEVNALGEPLREQHVGALEAGALLRKVMSEIDVAIFAFDEHQVLRLANRGGERLLGQAAERLLGRNATALGLAHCLDDDSPRVLDASFGGSVRRLELRRSSFRQGGMTHQLVVLTDLSKTLREEERLVWQRLVRVLSHEINNSLAPIKSIAASLQQLLQREAVPADRDTDLSQGLSVIAGRAESLNRFMAGYARLTRLPRPQLEPVDVREWIDRVVALEKRLAIHVAAGPPVVIRADGDQLDQLLINLVGNAVDAALETAGKDAAGQQGAVSVDWQRADDCLEVRVLDDGPGLPDTANVFVPFFTTKRTGTGIGLVLSRQIAEAHGGTLNVENRADQRGAVAVLRLPV
jgi:PAS domain S-box-containing protein